MFVRIKKAYNQNPILLINLLLYGSIFAFVLIFSLLQPVFADNTITKFIPTSIFVLIFVFFAFWLAKASMKRRALHKQDESKITYIALLIYAIHMYFTAIIGSIVLVSTLIHMFVKG